MCGPLHVCCDMNFFSVLEKTIIIFCLNETSQSSKFRLKIFLSHIIVDRQSMEMPLVRYTLEFYVTKYH